MAILCLRFRGESSRRSFLRGVLAAGSVAMLAAPKIHAADPMVVKKPAWNEVVALTQAHFAPLPNYKPGDIIARGEATQLLDKLAQAGWDVPERSKLLVLVLDDQHYLVQQSRTAAGRKFLRSVAAQPNAFDRLDRLTTYPGGKQLVHDIIRLPHGKDLLKPKPTPGFGDLTQLLPKGANGQTPKDKNFDKPTGKIYTERQLLSALEKSYAAR